MMVYAPNSRERLEASVNIWMQKELAVKVADNGERRVLDLTNSRTRSVLIDSLKASLRDYLVRQGFERIGVEIELFDDVETRVSYDADAETVVTDLVRATVIAGSLQPVEVAQGGWSTFGFDVDGDGA